MHFNAFTRAIFIQTESYRMDKASALALLLVRHDACIAAPPRADAIARPALSRRHGRVAAPGNSALGQVEAPALLFCFSVVFVGVGIPLLVLFSWLAGHTITDPVQAPLTLLLQTRLASARCRR